MWVTSLFLKLLWSPYLKITSLLIKNIWENSKKIEKCAGNTPTHFSPPFTHLPAKHKTPLILFVYCKLLRLLPSQRHRTLSIATNTTNVTSVFLCHAELLLYRFSVSVAQFALKIAKRSDRYKKVQADIFDVQCLSICMFVWTG